MMDNILYSCLPSMAKNNFAQPSIISILHDNFWHPVILFVRFFAKYLKKKSKTVKMSQESKKSGDIFASRWTISVVVNNITIGAGGRGFNSMAGQIRPL